MVSPLTVRPVSRMRSAEGGVDRDSGAGDGRGAPLSSARDREEHDAASMAAATAKPRACAGRARCGDGNFIGSGAANATGRSTQVLARRYQVHQPGTCTWYRVRDELARAAAPTLRRKWRPSGRGRK